LAKVNAPYVARIATATTKLLETVGALGDAAMAQPSLLPGWDRAMVVTHLAANADGLHRVIEAAKVGEVGEFYPGGRPARDAEIEAGRGRPAVELYRRLEASCERAMASLQDASDELWHAPAVHPAGERQIGALVVARLREVEVHHVDLDAGYSPADWPSEWVMEEMDRAMLDLPARLPHGVAVVLAATDADQHWVAGSGEAVELAGPMAELFAWLTGRSATVGGSPAPALAPWR
jgi:maleylpyruvate isomerase